MLRRAETLIEAERHLLIGYFKKEDFSCRKDTELHFICVGRTLGEKFKLIQYPIPSLVCPSGRPH